MIMTECTRNLAGIAFALAALNSAGATMAQERPMESRTEIVSFLDLDLATDRGVERLDQRLHRAVNRVCGRSIMQSVRESREARDCRDAAWESVQPQRSFAIAQALGEDGEVLAAGARGGRIQVAAAD